MSRPRYHPPSEAETPDTEYENPYDPVFERSEYERFEGEAHYGRELASQREARESMEEHRRLWGD